VTQDSTKHKSQPHGAQGGPCFIADAEGTLVAFWAPVTVGRGRIGLCGVGVVVVCRGGWP